MYGNMENKTAAPKNIMAKIYTIAGFLIALSIGLVCVSNIIHDRMKFRDEAVRNVETTWGKAQTIGVGELEYKEKDKKDINTYKTRNKIHSIICNCSIFNCGNNSIFI